MLHSHEKGASLIHDQRWPLSSPILRERTNRDFCRDTSSHWSNASFSSAIAFWRRARASGSVVKTEWSSSRFRCSSSSSGGANRAHPLA